MTAKIKKRFVIPNDNELNIIEGEIVEIRIMEDGDDESPFVIGYHILDKEGNKVYLAFEPEMFPDSKQTETGASYIAVFSEKKGQLLELMNPPIKDKDKFNSNNLDDILFGENETSWNEKVFDCRLLEYDSEEKMYEIECAYGDGKERAFTKKIYAEPILKGVIRHEFGAFIKIHLYECKGARIHFIEDGNGLVNPKTFNFEKEWEKIQKLIYQLKFDD